MATCKDCLHYDVCVIIENSVSGDEDYLTEFGCEDFKDRTSWYNNDDRDEIAEKLLLDAPTIDPERLRPPWAEYAVRRPHGRWIPFLDGDHIMPERYYRCSRCGRVERRIEPYCHCGAKMDLEE